MNIYTRGGDGGETSLPSGQRVPKSTPLIAGYGSLEELATLLGWLAVQEGITPPQKEQLIGLVTLAMEAGCGIANGKPEQPSGIPGLVGDLEQWIDEITAQLPPLNSFILPMGIPAAAVCHVVRTNCRRIERTLVDLATKEQVPPWVLPWLNRLADFLFVLARQLNHDQGTGDIPWQRK